jgi:cytidylate kinase
LIITLDGPVAAGKTSVARQLAGRLGIPLLDTGAIYRCVALRASQAGVSWHDEAATARIAEALNVSFGTGPEGQIVQLDGRDVTHAIRRPAISQGASIVSAHPAVRTALLDLQRKQGARGDLIAEGRDTGTVVFPQADHKFFLTATPAERAERRYRELLDRGHAADLEKVRRELEERDRRDAGRAVAPLVAPPDALTLDTTDLAIAEVVDRIEKSTMDRVPEHFFEQSAVLPYREERNRLEFLLITSRRRKRWVIPKGVRELDMTPAASAAKEALEEAGIEGELSADPIGTYTYEKWGGTCRVEVFAMAVHTSYDVWSEDCRDRVWLTPDEAVARLDEPELQQLVRSLAVARGHGAVDVED